MKQDGNIARNQNILNAIPKDVLDDVPEHKTDELRRGILPYLSKEAPELYQKKQKTSENCPKSSVSSLHSRYTSLLY